MKYKLPTSALRLLAATVVAAASLFAAPTVEAAAKGPVWEVVEAVDVEAVNVPSGDDSSTGVDVSVRDGHIYITVDRPVKIEVFTILGQLVTSRTLNPGTVRLTLGNRGIYILKGAGATRRINL